MMAYIITGKRSNGETVFVCSSETQGRRIVPNAQSMAEPFAPRSDALRVLSKMSDRYAGIKFKLERI